LIFTKNCNKKTVPIEKAIKKRKIILNEEIIDTISSQVPHFSSTGMIFFILGKENKRKIIAYFESVAFLRRKTASF